MALAIVAAATAHAGETLDAVRERGVVRCGAPLDVPGFGFSDSNGQLSGLEVDYCRAVAAAVLGDSAKVEIVPLTPQTRFPALQSGEVDVAFRSTTLTFTRDTTLGFLFGPYSLYDGQGVMVPASLGATKIEDLDGATICVVPGSNSELTIGDYFRAHNLSFTPISIENSDDLRRAFLAGRCDVFTSDRSYLAVIRSVAPNPDDYVVLDETIAKSSLAPIVRQGDDQWYNIIRWITYAPLVAEELGVSSANADDLRANSPSPTIGRFLGKQADFANGLGLDDAWAYNIVKAVGNYAEIYDRNLGEASPIKLKRGDNQLYKDGGLHYPPPFL
ncbi:amino acid ABC transporter substrate-binding protein [Sinirhodobacter populi]|uniref:Amino acid ABC transporter substrate-binding protein n=2 Tax=Paenirhodobacter populi TaxID=2306993 RepID=A0A443K4S6_9RHOB|nr:amino acid ABC transporter substrate-binding protein [Sinirhodobacter populi]